MWSGNIRAAWMERKRNPGFLSDTGLRYASAKLKNEKC